MGRVPCCEKENVKRGQWTPEEDNKLSSYIAQHGTRNWRLIPKNAGLQRCGKSCRLRWSNYLRPDLKHGHFTDSEEQTIVKLHAVVGNRWSLIAAQLPGRTDNDVKNYWNTKLKKKLSGMGIDPVTHKSFSHLMAEIATTLAPPQVAHLAEAALGCFKDEMLHLLTKRPHPNPNTINAPCNYNYTIAPAEDDDKEICTVEKIRRGLSRAIRSGENHSKLKQQPNWDSIVPGAGFDGAFVQSTCASPWDQSTSPPTMGVGHFKLEELSGQDSEPAPKDDVVPNTTFLGASECVLWDLPSDDLINPMP